MKGVASALATADSNWRQRSAGSIVLAMQRVYLLIQMCAVLIGALAAGSICDCSLAQAQTQNAEHRVSVGIFKDAPFVVSGEAGQWTGFAVETLLQATSRSGLAFEFREYPSLESLYRAVQSGEVEMGAGNTLVTSRDLQTVDFSQPILDGGLRIMVSKEHQHSFARLWEGLKRNGHVLTLLWAAVATISASIVLLVLLRFFDPRFHRRWRDGFAEAFYHVISVCVTGKTKYSGTLAGGWIGQIIAALWLCFGVATVAYVTSSITSVMTTNAFAGQVSGPKDLPGRVVGVLNGSAADRYCAVNDVQVVRFSNLAEAADALVLHRVDAVVSDAASLEAFDMAKPELPITETGEIFERRHFAFPVKPGSRELLHKINIGLLQLRESGILDHVRGEWFSR